MKIASSITVATAGIRCLTPAQYLLFKGTGAASDYKINVKLRNSRTGSVVDVISDMDLLTLAKIATTNEGHFVSGSTDGTNGFICPVMLNPVAALSLDNDKYLDIEVRTVTASKTLDIFAIENRVQSSFFVNYEKQVMESADVERTFGVGNAELVAIANTASVTEVVINYTGGASVVFTPEELAFIARNENDICYVKNSGCAYGLDGMVILPLEGVSSYKVKKASGSALTFYTIDNKE